MYRYLHVQQCVFQLITTCIAIKVSLSQFYPKIKWLQGSSGAKTVRTGQLMIGRDMCLRTSAAYTRPVEEPCTSYGEYQDRILRQVVVPYLEQYDLLFQQDNASTHTAEVVLNYFDQQGIEPLQWCPHSPDLSIIENIWHLLKMKLPVKVYEEREDFIAAIQLAWTQIEQENIDALFESIPNRVKECIEKQGGIPIIEPDSDIYKYQIINFTLLSVSKGHFGCRPLYRLIIYLLKTFTIENSYSLLQQIIDNIIEVFLFVTWVQTFDQCYCQAVQVIKICSIWLTI
ncbi:DDE_superfamily endonuclease domain-containing protein [Hexamita inflata]|uniref:DDE superfamily endonuclease domain-containing protein n=1 Tax=Hexamita inflata TaxID=28002 RepID=A0AA86P3G3_9EUKA|nr:DDE superfamily endonuclease domain-containing protein [Hexamita inflata]